MNYLKFFLGLGWLAAIAIGNGVLLHYEFTAGEVRGVPKLWPSEAQIPRANDQPTLLLFAHPRCPCTRATMGELATLIAHCPGLVDTRVIFFRPHGSDETWARTDLWRTAQAIPGVRVYSDEAAVEACKFNATTSGQVVLYDAQGHLMFSGGITSSRGHEGDNTGLSAVIDLLLHRPVAPQATPVFGCPLQAATSKCGAQEALCPR